MAKLEWHGKSDRLFGQLRRPSVTILVRAPLDPIWTLRS